MKTETITCDQCKEAIVGTIPVIVDLYNRIGECMPASELHFGSLECFKAWISNYDVLYPVMVVEFHKRGRREVKLEFLHQILPGMIVKPLDGYFSEHGVRITRIAEDGEVIPGTKEPISNKMGNKFFARSLSPKSGNHEFLICLDAAIDPDSTVRIFAEE